MRGEQQPSKIAKFHDRRQNGRAARVVYPSSDGKPMAETSVHIAELIHCFLTLEDFFAADAAVCVAADMFLYYEEGNPSACVAPDLFIVKGVAKHDRDSYKLWEEGAVPSFVLELTSASTAAEDQRKRELYSRLGVGEYVLYDPRLEGRRRTARGGALTGYRRQEDRYEPLPVAAEGGLLSEQLGLRLVVEGGRLQCYDLSTGRRLLDPRERAAVAEERAGAAEARVIELERLLRQNPPAEPPGGP